MGYITAREAEERLLSAAQTSGYVQKDGAPAAKATIRSGITDGMKQPRPLPATGNAANGTIRNFRVIPRLEGVDLPDMTEPDEHGKPKLYAIGRDQPTAFPGEVRRHIYWRDGQAVRVKIKNGADAKAPWTDCYRVRRPTDGAVGWQAKKPEMFEPLPYIGPQGTLNPFAPEHIKQVLVWAEGEKDVDTLQRHGYAAFTFGSASDVPDCDDLLCWRHIIIVVDNDEAGERSLLRKVAAARKTAANVRVVRFHDLPKGGDASDFFEAGHTAQDFLDRAETPPENADEELQESNVTSQAQQPRLVILYGDEEPTPPRYLVKDLLPQAQTAIVSGQFSAGKTTICSDLSYSVMTGEPFAGREIMRPGAVLWLGAEGADEVDVRLKAVALHRSGDAKLGKLPFARQAFDVPTLTAEDAFPKLQVIVEATQTEVRRRFPNLELVLIVIDTLASAAAFQDENSASEAQKVWNTLRRLSDLSGALVLVVDHHGKAQETGVRGSSAKSGAADAILAALAEKSAEGEISNRRLAIMKLRSGRSGHVTPFTLKPIEVDVWGNTSCAVEWQLASISEQAAEEVEKPKADWSNKGRIFKAAMVHAMLENGAKKRPFGFEGPEVRTVAFESVRVEFNRRYPAVSADAKRKAFKRESDTALAKQLVASREIDGVDQLWFVKDADVIEAHFPTKPDSRTDTDTPF